MPLDKDIEDILDPILATFDDTLQAEVAGQIAEINISGTAEMVTWGKTKAGVPIAYEGPPIQGAIDWAGKHSATLVKGLDEETKKRLAHTISQGIETKRGVPGLARDIRTTFADMSKHRSELIARTETANALSQASLDTMEDMGIDGKEWITAGDDRVSEECEANENEGVIPANQDFTSGVMAPPQHPDCRCTVSPSRLPAKAKPPAKPAPKVPTRKPPTRGNLTGDDWVKTVTRDQKRAMDYWQGSGYEKMRAAQQTGKAPASIKGAIKDLNVALDKAKPYDGQVFRGLNNLDKKTFNLLKNSKEMKWDALASSAKTEKAAARFIRGTKGDRIMFKIQNKTGVDLTTLYKQEAEVLLRKNASYRVAGQSEKVYTVGKEKIKALEMILVEI